MINRTLLTVLVVLGVIVGAGVPAIAAQTQSNSSSSTQLTGIATEQTSATLHIAGNVSAGENVTITAMLNSEPLAHAEVEVNDQFVGHTDENGTLTNVAVPNAASVEFEVESENAKMELELEDAALQRAAAVGETNASVTIDSNLIVGESINVTAMLFDQGMSNATVEVNGDDVATTDGNGTAMVTVPHDDEFEVKVETEDAKLELELEDTPRPANGAEGTSVVTGDGPFRIVVTAADGTEVLNTTVDPGTDFEIEFETEDGKTKVKIEQGEDEFEMEREQEDEEEQEDENDDNSGPGNGDTEQEDEREDEQEDEREDEQEDEQEDEREDDNSGSGNDDDR